MRQAMIFNRFLLTTILFFSLLQLALPRSMATANPGNECSFLANILPWTFIDTTKNRKKITGNKVMVLFAPAVEKKMIICFRFEDESQASINIYDASKKRLAVIPIGPLSKGSYFHEVDISNYPDGQYCVKFQEGPTVFKKMFTIARKQ